jgi:hypothetical protein
MTRRTLLSGRITWGLSQDARNLAPAGRHESGSAVNTGAVLSERRRRCCTSAAWAKDERAEPGFRQAPQNPRGDPSGWPRHRLTDQTVDCYLAEDRQLTRRKTLPPSRRWVSSQR